MKKALDAYEKAAEWFEGDNAEAYDLISPADVVLPVWVQILTPIHSHRLANKHFLKVADLSALEAEYYKAIEHYERIGRSSVNNTLMKWSVKDYFFKAGICHLATNVRPPAVPIIHDAC